MSIANDDIKAYEKLIKRFPLRPIRDEEQNRRAAEICDMLTDRINSLSQGERDYLEILTDLVTKYESQWDADALSMSPRELVQYLMDQNGLAQKDLVPEFGSPSRVSEFLKGERRLSLVQAKRLAGRFSLNISALIDTNDLPRSGSAKLVDETPGTSDPRRVSLRNLFVHNQPVSYKLLFDACTHIEEEQDPYILQLLRRPVKTNDFSDVYCTVFNSINLWLIQVKSTPIFRSCAFVSEDIDVEGYMSFLRPEYMAWENSIRNDKRHKKRWLNKYSVETYGDFLKALHLVAEQNSQIRQTFWEHSIDHDEGQAAFERFAIDLYEELAKSS